MSTTRAKRSREADDALDGNSDLGPDDLASSVPDRTAERSRVGSDDDWRGAHGSAGSPSSSDISVPSSMTFGFYVWTEVSMVLFYRFTKEVQSAAVALASLAGDTERQRLCLATLNDNLHIIWEVGKVHLPEDERRTHDGLIRHFISGLVSSIRASLGADALEAERWETTKCDEAAPPVSEAAKGPLSPASTGGRGGSQNDIIDTCKVLERALEDNGFPDDEGNDVGTLGGGLANLVAETRQSTELHCYSYSERTTMNMPLLPRYEGEKRAEEDYDQPRWGYVVTLPCPHPHPEVNTRIQLIEPKRRRPTLDESRIFSHPKKTVTHGVEDFMVEEELSHRAFVVLRQHLDTHGSLKGLSPYARFLLWNVVLDRDDAAFDKLLDQPATTLEARRRLEEARVALGARFAAFMEVRAAARVAAQRIGWYAVSAQWRDQALSRLEDVEDVDWYLLGDVVKLGGRAVFPNYASSAAVRHFAQAIVGKLDTFFSRRHHEDRDEAVPVTRVVNELFLPLLLGQQPSDFTAVLEETDHQEDLVGPKRQRERRRLKALFSRHPVSTSCTNNGVNLGTLLPTTADLSGMSRMRGQTGVQETHVCLSPSLVFPLQCVAELLELCSLAQYAEDGLRTFAARIVSADWSDEESLLQFLLQEEPLNSAIAPMVALPKVYRDLVTGVQLMYHDRMVPAVVDAIRTAGERGMTYSHEHHYAYWKALSTLFQEEARQDDLLFLTVSLVGTTGHNSDVHAEVGLPLYRESVLERARRVWHEDIRELLDEEEVYKKTRLAGFSD